VIEIGPGKGAITEILAGRAGRLVALELDRELAPMLKARFRDQANVEIVETDVLEAELAEFVPERETADVIGNLPYYITSDILLQLFAAGNAGKLHRAVVMMQREVAERVAAEPGNREWGLLSATAQMSARVEMLFTLPPGAFSPPPEVYSTVLRLEFAARFEELGVDAAGFDRFLKACFAQKRKTLGNNLRAAGYGVEAVAGAGVQTNIRAEEMGVEELAEVYRKLLVAGC
jgi:16S rRNA (adenine1518-N6/adenine1519-N6)-dimethyltransferase